MDFKFEPKRSYVKAFQKFLTKRNYKEHHTNDTLPFFCTQDYSGLYCIEFQNVTGVDLFNKSTNAQQLEDCQYYPPTAVVKQPATWDKLKLENNKFYFLKPKYGSQAGNISISQGKRIIFDQDTFSALPMIVQEEISPKLQNGCKIDYRTYVLYVKNNNNLSAYYYPYHIKRVCKAQYEPHNDRQSFFSEVDNTNSIVRIEGGELERCLKDAQRYLIKHLPRQNYSKLEFFITGCDVIEDSNGKFWIMEINWDPAFVYNKEVHSMHADLINDIIDATETYHKSGNLGFNLFREL